MEDLYNQKVIDANQVFSDRFINVKALFMYNFHAIPDIHFISKIDAEKAFNAFPQKFGEYIKHIHKYRWYEHKKKKGFQFYKTVIILNNSCIIELDDNYCMILHNSRHEQFVNEVSAFILKFKEKQKRMPAEINIIVKDSNGFDLKPMEIKRTKIDPDLFYPDDFKQVDAVIQKRLQQKKDKGIVLLHGLPGTGKTTYLRYLIGKLKKRVMFLSPNVAGNLMNPEFIDLLIDNPNTVLVIEDAENIIMDRKVSNDSSVSNLLNISDGLLADFLNVQLICTFNRSLTMVDSALMRKGRLIGKYEFEKLSVAKSQRLSDHLGFKNIIHKLMTVAEISNQNEIDFDITKIEVVGFRREIINQN
ncbi:MAG TPA: AAA family ATPase [Hanamia sp.]|nr:AAA family ATPase [Hanamia sp.]